MHVGDHRPRRADDEPGEDEAPVPVGRVPEREQDGRDDREGLAGEDEVLARDVAPERACEAEEGCGDADGYPGCGMG